MSKNKKNSPQQKSSKSNGTTDKPFDAGAYFTKILEEDRNLSAGIGAIKTLLTVLKESKLSTVQELDSTIQLAVEAMKKTSIPITGVVSASELFSRFISFAKFDDKTMDECKEIMLHRGECFLNKLLQARATIAKKCVPFVSENCKIITHSRSRVVLETLKLAVNSNKRFKVLVTTSSMDDKSTGGEQMCKDLREAGIDCTLILDSAIGYVMESVDMVMVGAEGVVESGGIINRIGTFTMALCANKMNKPVYVLAESFKFSRLFPLNQRDLDDEYKYSYKDLQSGDLEQIHPLVDYTPPAFLTLLFTDLGILTPSAVSDELIKLYL